MTDFNAGYGITLAPGVYCFAAAATLTGTLTLAGPANGTWTFEIGSGMPPTGALTGTSFSVVMAGGGLPCNVNWWVAQAATMTDSQFVGTILAGAAITLTEGTFSGNALAKAGVTITGTNLVGCAAAGGKGHGKEKAHCNQGVGNGPEGCDPGNSNNRHTSNDELGGTPGHPGRQGGNHNSSVAATDNATLTSNVIVAAKGNSSHNSSAVSAAKANNSSLNTKSHDKSNRKRK